MHTPTDGLQRQFDLIRSIPLNKALSGAEQQRTSITAVRKGGLIIVEDEPYAVIDLHTYAEKEGMETWLWYELVLLHLFTLEQVYLSWEEDDEVEVFLYDTKVTEQIKGLESKRLVQMDDDEDEDCEYEVRHRGESYWYEDSGEAEFCKGKFCPQGSSPTGERFSYWEFYTEDGKEALSVEQWGDEREVWIGKRLRKAGIRVILQEGMVSEKTA